MKHEAPKILRPMPWYVSSLLHPGLQMLHSYDSCQYFGRKKTYSDLFILIKTQSIELILGKKQKWVQYLLAFCMQNPTDTCTPNPLGHENSNLAT